ALEIPDNAYEMVQINTSIQTETVEKSGNSNMIEEEQEKNERTSSSDGLSIGHAMANAGDTRGLDASVAQSLAGRPLTTAQQDPHDSCAKPQLTDDITTETVDDKVGGAVSMKSTTCLDSESASPEVPRNRSCTDQCKQTVVHKQVCTYAHMQT